MAALRHLFEGDLVSVGVHGGQEVDAGVGDQLDDALVPSLVLLADVLHEVEQQLPAQYLVPMHPCNVAELWLSCRGRQSTGTGMEFKTLC